MTQNDTDDTTAEPHPEWDFDANSLGSQWCRCTECGSRHVRVKMREGVESLADPYDHFPALWLRCESCDATSEVRPGNPVEQPETDDSDTRTLKQLIGEWMPS